MIAGDDAMGNGAKLGIKFTPVLVSLPLMIPDVGYFCGGRGGVDDNVMGDDCCTIISEVKLNMSAM